MYAVVDRHLQQIDPYGIYILPGVSRNVPTNFSSFGAQHLQKCGLLNDGNVCAHLSFILCCHRMQLQREMIDLAMIMDQHGAHDLPLCVFKKILCSLPSTQAFSIQCFIQSWNLANKHPNLQAYDDIWAVADGILSQLPLRVTRNQPPVFTMFSAKYQCTQCGHQDEIDNWGGKSFSLVPNLQMTRSQAPVDVTQLLDTFVAQRFDVRCGSCRSQVSASYKVTKGKFTAIGLSRVPDHGDPDRTKISTKLVPNVVPQSPRESLLEELISVSSHIGGLGGGHWISYHKASSNWWCNNDSSPIVMKPHPFNVMSVNETVNFLVFANNNF